MSTSRTHWQHNPYFRYLYDDSIKKPMDFENKPQLGIGIYTPPEIAQILRLPYSKVHRWIDKYWDGELGKEFETRYSWYTDGSRAVSFHTLVELYVMVQFAEAGVKTRKVLEAHKELSRWFDTAFPFAKKEVLEGLRTDGAQIYIQRGEDTITLNGTRQLNLELIELFFKNLDFDSNQLATRLWPMGKKKSILIDPQRKFGHPVIGGKNIYPQTIYGMYNAGEPKDYIAYLYELTNKEVQDAIDYCEAA